jgi:hypothetical protein
VFGHKAVFEADFELIFRVNVFLLKKSLFLHVMGILGSSDCHIAVLERASKALMIQIIEGEQGVALEGELLIHLRKVSSINCINQCSNTVISSICHCQPEITGQSW